jgi:hypothetical protein
MTMSCRVEATKAATMSDADVRKELRKAFNQMVDTFNTDFSSIWALLVPGRGVAIDDIIRSNAPLGKMRYYFTVQDEAETEPQVVSLQNSAIPTNQQ